MLHLLTLWRSMTCNLRGWKPGQDENMWGTIADFDRAIAIDPKNANAYTQRGSLYQLFGELDRAIADLTTAVALNPNNAEAYLNRGFAFEKKDEPDRAIADFRKALEIEPSNRRAKESLELLGRRPGG